MMDEAASSAPTEAITAIDSPEPKRSEEEASTASPSQDQVLTQESNAVVPVSPATTDRGGKRSFWRRIAPARAAQAEATESLSVQVEALAAQLAAAEQSITTRLEATERSFEEVWEVEEQLSILREAEKRIEGLETSQKALLEAVSGLKSTVAGTAIVLAIGLAVVGAIAAGALSF